MQRGFYEHLFEYHRLYLEETLQSFLRTAAVKSRS